jgi:methyl-accepting chemotaxis protein
MAVLIQDIASNAREQAVGLNQMNDAIVSIDHAVQQSAALVEESASLAQYLGDVSQTLDELVGQFQLGNCNENKQSALNQAYNSDHIVLVVDDAIVNQKVAVSMLRKLGYDTDTAANGREAIEKASQHHYQAILMDLDMPIMNGFDATKSLRNKGDHTPIIAFTGHSGKLQEKCFHSGMNSFLTKPLDINKLQAALQRKNSSTTVQETPKQRLALSAPKSAGYSGKAVKSDEWSEF